MTNNRKSGAQPGNKNAFKGIIHPPSTRKSGGQPGNHNALKNGIYAQFITLADELEMMNMPEDDILDELNLARLYLTKALQERDSAKTVKERLAWDFASHYWLDTVIHIKIKNMERKETAVEVWDSYIDAIRNANDKQVIKR
jgi:hypothetical protein